MTSKKELLEKIQALAKSGKDGEREVATAKLEMLMKKYGISEKDLCDDIKEVHYFKIVNEDHKQIMFGVFAKVLKWTGTSYRHITPKGHPSKKDIGVKMAAAQALEIQYMIDFYWAQWQTEFKRFGTAFFSKHRLFNPDDLEKEDRHHNLSEEEMSRIYSQMDAMDDVSPRVLIS